MNLFYVYIHICVIHICKVFKIKLLIHVTIISSVLDDIDLNVASDEDVSDLEMQSDTELVFHEVVMYIELLMY